MPIENLEDEGLDKNPNLLLAQWRFLLTLPDHANDAELQNQLREVIVKESEYTLFACHRFFIPCPRAKSN